jgi:hypothetical protein
VPQIVEAEALAFCNLQACSDRCWP